MINVQINIQESTRGLFWYLVVIVITIGISLAHHFSKKPQHYYLIKKIEGIEDQKKQDRIITKIKNKYGAGFDTEKNSISFIGYPLKDTKEGEETWVECYGSRENGDPAVLSVGPDESVDFPILNKKSKFYYLAVCNGFAKTIMNDKDVFKVDK